MNLGLKDVVDYVVRIRAQDVQFYSTLLTIFAGSILAAIVISLFTRGSKDKNNKSRGALRPPSLVEKIEKMFFLGVSAIIHSLPFFYDR